MAAAVMTAEMPTGSVTIRTEIHPMGDPPLPTVCMGGIKRDIPIVTFGEQFGPRVELYLGNLDDAADYLRRMSRQLVALACEVEAGREKARERMPEGAA
jgi:hypothetical protein